MIINAIRTAEEEIRMRGGDYVLEGEQANEDLPVIRIRRDPQVYAGRVPLLSLTEVDWFVLKEQVEAMFEALKADK